MPNGLDAKVNGSATANRTTSPSGVARTVIVPPSGVNLTALPIRLENSWMMRS